MADKSIGDLNFAPGTVDDSNTLFVVQQSGAAYKLSGHEFIIAMESVLDGHGGINNITYTPPVAPSLTGTMVITLADQSTTSVSIQNGKGISTITDYWKASSSSSSVPSSWSTTRESMTSTNRYLWHYQHIVYNDNTYLDTTKTVVGVYGDTGDAWYVWIRYSGSQPTQDSDMGTTPDNWMGIYSGTSSTAPTHYTDYQWFEIKGEKGDTGDPATITDTAVEYQVSSSGTVIPSGTWTTTVPTVTQGDFLWTRTTLEFNSGSPIVSYAVAYQAIDGQGAPSSATPLMDAGSGSAGIGTAFSRDDHIHPTDTTRAAVADFKSFTVTLTTTGWSNKAQTVSNSNFVTSGYAYMVSPASASFLDYGSAQIYADDVTTNGQMTFHCEDVPSSALTVNITRVVSA